MVNQDNHKERAAPQKVGKRMNIALVSIPARAPAWPRGRNKTALTGKRIRAKHTPRPDVVEEAVKLLMEDQTVSYVEAARIYDVRIHQLRARINYRYGSLEAARNADWVFKPPMWSRPCETCGDQERRLRGLKTCSACRGEGEDS